MHCSLPDPDKRLHVIWQTSVQAVSTVLAACIDQHVCGTTANGNSNGMLPHPARVKSDDDDIFGDAGTDYICELPKVRQSCL